MARDKSSLTVPLVVEEKQGLGRKLEDVETTYSDSTTGTTSSFKTVFHGLNALSGFTLSKCAVPDVESKLFIPLSFLFLKR